MSTETEKARSFRLYSSKQLQAVINRMASELACLISADEQIVIVGILRRGAPLADLLSESLRSVFGRKNFVRTDIKINRYADDLTVLHPETLLHEIDEQSDVDFVGKTLILVDDVLFEGYSLLRALDYFVKKQPSRIISVVLVDRCVVKLPVRADVIGVRLQIAPGDVVECCVPPYEERFEICVVQRELR
jgi:pyrimidine operon attenuation protein / uracil phosphoribosyltransferase